MRLVQLLQGADWVGSAIALRSRLSPEPCDEKDDRNSSTDPENPLHSTLGGAAGFSWSGQTTIVLVLCGSVVDRLSGKAGSG
ncbi:hypothetical protein H6F51_14030 [Cyanobacteria bacterium FACHB-DQ100]|nr:hypothetical protein [Cyanobacteria bacterium FACHB-DQ100]